MASDYDLSDDENEYPFDEEMIDGTLDDYGELNTLFFDLVS